MNLDQLTSSAAWNVRTLWRQGHATVLARRSPTGKGWSVGTPEQLGKPVSYLLADGWRVVTEKEKDEER